MSPSGDTLCPAGPAQGRCAPPAPAGRERRIRGTSRRRIPAPEGGAAAKEAQKRLWERIWQRRQHKKGSGSTSGSRSCAGRVLADERQQPMVFGSCARAKGAPSLPPVNPCQPRAALEAPGQLQAGVHGGLIPPRPPCRVFVALRRRPGPGRGSRVPHGILHLFGGFSSPALVPCTALAAVPGLPARAGSASPELAPSPGSRGVPCVGQGSPSPEWWGWSGSRARGGSGLWLPLPSPGSRNFSPEVFPSREGCGEWVGDQQGETRLLWAGGSTAEVPNCSSAEPPNPRG